MRVWI